MESLRGILEGMNEAQKSKRVEERVAIVGTERRAEATESVEREMTMEYLQAKYKKMGINVKKSNFKFEIVLNEKIIGDEAEIVEDEWCEEFDDPKDMEESMLQLNWFLNKLKELSK